MNIYLFFLDFSGYGRQATYSLLLVMMLKKTGNIVTASETIFNTIIAVTFMAHIEARYIFKKYHHVSLLDSILPEGEQQHIIPTGKTTWKQDLFPIYTSGTYYCAQRAVKWNMYMLNTDRQQLLQQVFQQQILWQIFSVNTVILFVMVGCLVRN